jgi:diguanylate cyclase (GGDEF)-like protein
VRSDDESLKTLDATRPLARVFLSHASHDAGFVEDELIPLLRDHHIAFWYSKNHIDPATQWASEIQQALQECNWFLVVMTPHSAESRWVRMEVDWAMEERHGRIVPVVLETTDPRQWHVGLRAIQFIDFRHNRREARGRLLSAFGATFRGRPSLPPPEPSGREPRATHPSGLREGSTHRVTGVRKLLSLPGAEAGLVFIYPPGPDLGRLYHLRGSEVVIGRGEDCEIRIQDHSVSRRHARIEPSIDGNFVSDQRSTNGTFINSRVLDGPSLLQNGDELRVGNCILRYHTGAVVEAEHHEEIYRLTIVDGLTQIHNQRYLSEFLDRELARSRRRQRPLSVVLFDIDHFMRINDSFGHLCGDVLLRELAATVRGTIRREDLFARYGGEEFALVLVDADGPEAMKFAEVVRGLVADHQFRFDATSIRLNH